MMAKIQALLEGEWFPDQSDRENYKFLALHYSVYNRYAEQVRTLLYPDLDLLSKGSKFRVMGHRKINIQTTSPKKT